VLKFGSDGSVKRLKKEEKMREMWKYINYNENAKKVFLRKKIFCKNIIKTKKCAEKKFLEKTFKKGKFHFFIFNYVNHKISERFIHSSYIKHIDLEEKRPNNAQF
jgi:hypothetical protein